MTTIADRRTTFRRMHASGFFLLPNAWTAEKIQYAVREWLGLLWYKAHGRL